MEGGEDSSSEFLEGEVHDCEEDSETGDKYVDGDHDADCRIEIIDGDASSKGCLLMSAHTAVVHVLVCKIM